MMPIKINHNFDGRKFKWLYAKYAFGCNPAHHCTNAIRGKYSKLFSRLNKDFIAKQTLLLDEYPSDSWDAIYICGVSANGYAQHKNYPHNVHAVLIPKEGAKDHWSFENWEMDIENAVFESIPAEADINHAFVEYLPEEYFTCRMFRWAVSHYPDDVKEYAKKIIRQTGYDYCESFCSNMVLLRNDYKSQLEKGERFSQKGFVAWVIACLRDPDAVSETFWGELRGSLNEWCLFYDNFPDEELFEEGVEQYIKKHFAD